MQDMRWWRIDNGVCAPGCETSPPSAFSATLREPFSSFVVRPAREWFGRRNDCARSRCDKMSASIRAFPKKLTSISFDVS